jgi:hypothetical protein
MRVDPQVDDECVWHDRLYRAQEYREEPEVPATPVVCCPFCEVVFCNLLSLRTHSYRFHRRADESLESFLKRDNGWRAYLEHELERMNRRVAELDEALRVLGEAP